MRFGKQPLWYLLLVRDALRRRLFLWVFGDFAGYLHLFCIKSGKKVAQ